MGMVTSAGCDGGGGEVEQEAKLIRLPKDGSVLVAEMRKFAEERGCEVKVIGVPDASTFVKVAELALSSLGVEVHLMAEVREGCVLLTV